MIQDFKDFALKGNLLELAVAFVMGAAFTAVVTSLINDVLMNFIAATVGRPDFSALTFKLGDGVIKYGSFLTALVTFLLIALALFLIVRAAHHAMPPEVTTKDCPHCLSTIPVAAPACAHCTRDVAAYDS